MGGITVTRRFKIAKIVPFRSQRWPPWRPSINSSNYISSQTISRIEPKLDGRHHSDTEIQNCKNRSVLISKLATMAAILKFFKRHLPTNLKFVCLFDLGLTSLSTIFQSYRDGVWMWQGAQCSLLECCLTEISSPRHFDMIFHPVTLYWLSWPVLALLF